MIDSAEFHQIVKDRILFRRLGRRNTIRVKMIAAVPHRQLLRFVQEGTSVVAVNLMSNSELRRVAFDFWDEIADRVKEYVLGAWEEIKE